MLEVVTEQWESLRGRYPMALARVYQAWDERACQTFRPGLSRECVFDCPNGMRFIVSRDVFTEGGVPRLHVSVSGNTADAFEGLNGRGIALKVTEAFYRISGLRLRFSWPPDWCKPPKYVPHWIFEDVAVN